MLFRVLEIGIVTLCCLLAASVYAHIFQMQRYQMPVYSQWLKRSRDQFLKNNVLIGLFGAAMQWYLPILLSLFVQVESTRNSLAGWLTLLSFAGVTVGLALRHHHQEDKHPFSLTLRARRLMAMTGALLLALVLSMVLLSVPPYLTYAVLPYVVWLAGRIMDPVEARINAGFYEEARKKLAGRKDLIRIGITGSYGKTLTKFILRGMLSQKYKVLATPASFNTAMGISRVINDRLAPEHQVFIAEMGAQHVGDIKNLVRLVRPQYGVITSIGPQHLDTFGSIANVAEAKNELIEGLPEDGAAFFAADSGYTDRLYGMCKREKYNAAVEKQGEFSMLATDVLTDQTGTRFTLSCADGGQVSCRTRLLGRLNVQNIALAAAVARKLGLTMEEIAEGIARLQPFERKLQLIPGERFIIDDTLGGSAAGTAEALGVLAEFPGRRVIITSGLTETNGRMEDANYAFGTQMDGCVDAAILVGDRQTVRPIAKGLLSTGFPKNMIFFSETLEDADEILNEISAPGDSVLYEGEIVE